MEQPKNNLKIIADKKKLNYKSRYEDQNTPIDPNNKWNFHKFWS